MRRASWASPLALLLGICAVLGAGPAQGAACSSAATGNWTVAATWVAGCPAGGPTGADTVTINAGHTVTINIAAAAAQSVTFSAAGGAAALTHAGANVLTVGTGGVTITGSNSANGSKAWNINAGSATVGTALANANVTLNEGSNNNRTADIIITTGSLTVNGNVQMNNAGANGRTAITMSGGAGNLLISGSFTLSNALGTLTPGATSTVTYFSNSAARVAAAGAIAYANLVINKAGGTATLSANGLVGAAFTVAAGTFSTSTFALGVAGNFDVDGTLSGTGQVFLTGAGTTIDGTGSITNTAQFNISGGAKTIQGAATLSFAGTIAIAGAIAVTNNGTVTTTAAGGITGSAVGSTWLNAVNSSLTLSGPLLATGTLNAAANPNTVNYAGAAAQTIKGTTYHHLTLSNAAAKTAGGALTVNGNLTLSGSATFGGGNNLTHIFRGNWVVNTSAGTPFAFTGTSTINFNTPVVAAQTSIGGTSVATLAFNDVNVNNTSGVALNQDASFSTGTTPTLIIGNGATLTPAAAVIVSGTGALQGVAVGTARVTRATGTNDFNTQYTIATKTLTNLTIEYAGAAAQGVSTVAYPRLRINNPNGVTLAANVTVSTLLTFLDGNITTGAFTLITSASCAAPSVTRTSGHVVGNLQKAIPAGASTCTFEVGSGANYAPVVLVFIAGTGAGNITASTTGTDHGSIGSSGIDATRSVNRFWTLTTGGVTLPAGGYTARFNFINGSPVDFDLGATPANFAVERWSGTLWFPTTLNATCAAVSGAHLCEQINAATAFGEFAIGEALSGFNPNPGAFNTFETTTTVGSVLGRIYTKRAGVNFTLRIQAVANNGVNTAPSTAALTIAVLDSSGTPGTFNAATNCWSLWPTVAAATTVPAAVGWVAGQGRIDVVITAPATAVRNARIRVTQGANVGCSTDNFSIRPSSFAVTSTNATNTGTTGTPTFKTGANFSLTATAIAGYDGTPGINNTLVVGTPTAGTIGGTFPAATGGASTGASFFYDQVGNFGLSTNAVFDSSFASVDQPNDCTANFSNALAGGKYGCSFGSVAVADPGGLGFGRFIPDNFNVSVNAPQFGTACGAFTYMGQSFTYVTPPVMMVTARTGTANGLTNATTSNYAGSYVKMTNTTLTPNANQDGRYAAFDALGGAQTPALVFAAGMPTPATDPSISFTAGVGTLTFGTGTGGVGFLRGTTAPTNPFNADIALALNVIDGDSVAFASNPASFGAATANNGIAFVTGNAQRYGIMKLGNAVGAETLNLPIPLETQYWTPAGFVRNTLDNCTTVNATSISLGGHQGGLSPVNMGNSHISLPSGAFPGGVATLTLTPPTPAASGSVNVTIDLTAEGKPHLRTNQSGAGYVDNPVGRAAFGVYGSQPRNFIYFRELY